MSSSFKISTVALSLALASLAIWVLFQTTPNYYKRYAFASILQDYISRSGENHIYDLSTFPRFEKILVTCGERARPTRRKNLVVFNPHYHERAALDWVVIIKGRDFESWRKGHLILWNDGRIRREKVTHTLIEKKKDLKFYYLLL